MRPQPQCTCEPERGGSHREDPDHRNQADRNQRSRDDRQRQFPPFPCDQAHRQATASQTAAIDVTQSQVTTGESLFAEQPHGLDAITKTDSSTAANAHAPKTKATTLVVRRYAFGGAAVTTRLSLWAGKDLGAQFSIRLNRGGR